MALTARTQTAPLIPAGQYPARCIDVYDAGWWPTMDRSDEVQKVKLVFVVKVGDVHRYIDIFESLSLGKKANLAKFIESWIGRELTDDERKEGIDVEKFANVTALIQIAHKPDGSRAIIKTIMALPKEMRALAPSAPSDYVVDAKRDRTYASQHPMSEKKRLALAAVSGEPLADEGDFPPALEDTDDDLPF